MRVGSEASGACKDQRRGHVVNASRTDVRRRLDTVDRREDRPPDGTLHERPRPDGSSTSSTLVQRDT
eukprot:7517994-Lingulodinium_polyedra.AAC.1